jgi:hypothetical protein
MKMPPKSKSQARLMRAAAHGDIELEGMSKEEAREYVAGHKVKHLPERVEKFVEEKRKLSKNSNFNRVSAGMEEYIIDWIQKHPYLEDKEFDRFLASSGYSPEQGKEVLYRYINGLRKSLPARINNFISKRAAYSPIAHRTFVNPETGIYSKYPSWDEQGERVMPPKAAWAEKQAMKKRGYDVKYIKLPDGNAKLIRTKNTPAAMPPEDIEDYNTHAGDVGLPEDKGASSSYLNPQATSGLYNTGWKIPKMPDQDTMMTRFSTKPRLRTGYPTSGYSNGPKIGSSKSDYGISLMKKELSNKINKFVRKKKEESLPYNQGTFGVSQAGVGARV